MTVATGLWYERTSTGSLTSPGVKNEYDPPNGWIVVTPVAWPKHLPPHRAGSDVVGRSSETLAVPVAEFDPGSHSARPAVVPDTRGDVVGEGVVAGASGRGRCLGLCGA
jgi:hypothetical protein